MTTNQTVNLHPMNTPPQDTLKVIQTLLTFLADDVPELLGLDADEDLEPGSTLHDARLMAAKARDLAPRLWAEIATAAEAGAETADSVLLDCHDVDDLDQASDWSNYNDSLPDLIAQRIVRHAYLRAIGRC